MLKHATICRIKRAEQALAQSMEVPAEIDHAASPFVSTTTDPETIASIKQDDGDVNNNFQDKFASLLSNGNWLSSAKGQIGSNIVTSCSSSPTPSLQSTTMSRVGSLSSAPSSVFNSPSKAKPSLTDSMIKIYFDQINLNQVEYMTLPVNTQTKSQEIIRTLLRKLRLKHRDPNLFYLILERYIRKDGLKCKSAMILGSDACPLQLQRCCSNPPHNDIKFTLHMRPGALIKIFCDDVCPNSKYKCITLSPQTTVEETIELMLYCLNLAVPTDARKNSSIIDRSVSSAAMLSTHVRQASSPGSTDSASSSASSTSSSSGIESDPTSNQNNFISNQANSDCRRRLETPSRTGSVTSISSSSNFSNFSNGQSHSQQYCLVIECEDTNFEQVLGSEEYLVDAYQNLLDEVREQAQQQQPTTSGGTDTKLARSASLSSPPSIKHQPDQWFVVKLKRREELSNIKFTNPRQNMPLPPIPSSVVELSNANIKNFVSTTQIEVNNNQQHRPSHSIAIAQSNKSTVVATESSAITTMNASEPASWHQRNVSAVVISNSRSENKMEPPPAHLIWMPQVKPRRRNLSSASSTFGTQAPHSLASLTQPLSQTTSVSNGLTCGNRRRYDPAQLAEDLKQIDQEPPPHPAPPLELTHSMDHDTSLAVDLNDITLSEWPRLLTKDDNASDSARLERANELPLYETLANDDDLERIQRHGETNFTRQIQKSPAITSTKEFKNHTFTTAHNKTSRSVDSRLHHSSASTPLSSPGHLMATGSQVATSAAYLQVATAESKIEQDPECALILKRTYILKGAASSKDEWGEKFVFNDVDPDDAAALRAKKKIHKTDLCIKHSDVDKAFEEALHRIKFEKPSDLDSLDVGERSLASVGELNLATGLLLSKRFDFSHDEILNALPMIDMSASNFFSRDLCPKLVRPMTCIKSRYRTITAHCNNLQHPTWGASKTPYSRYLPPDYADGLSAPRASRTGQPLPSARLITSIIHVDHDAPSHDYSTLFADWGQLLNHDITRVAVGEAPDCCPQYLKGLCMPIPVPVDDPLYTKFDVKCLKFERSLAAIRPKCLLGHRAQVNLITSPVDASFVYGSTKQQARRLRSFSEGKLKVWNYFEHSKKPLLPAMTEDPDKNCLGRPKKLFCFEAGDMRVNEQTHLTVLHTIYVREHNRIAKQLAKINMEWDDEKLYHETRHIVAACVQHVMVNEFLPLLLGHKHITDYQLKPSDGYWNGYDPSVTISTGTAFAAAAFRYGHSMIEGIIRRLDPKSGAFIKSEQLRHLFKRPFWLYEPGAIDQLIAGMLLSPSEQTDPFMSEELSGHLFQPPKAKFGHDLAAINIQRGRDQGVPGYNDWREWCGLKRAKSFDDLEPLLMSHTAWQYSKIYKHVDDIDLWSAGISERKLPKSAVGPTMACIISRQFLNYKRGDRFWYENPSQPSSFTPGQLREIKKITLAKVLCTNADDLPRIQPWAMRLPHPIYNAKVACSSLPDLNLKLWDSSLMDSFD